MSDKPIIRHCRNCKYSKLDRSGAIFCDVRYEYYSTKKQRKTARFCRHYKPEDLTKRVNLPKATSAIENLTKAFEKLGKNIGGKNMDTNLQELREKIKGHILAIREDVKNAGFDTDYFSIASFEDEESNSAHINNSPSAKKRLVLFYNFTEEEP